MGIVIICDMALLFCRHYGTVEKITYSFRTFHKHVVSFNVSNSFVASFSLWLVVIYLLASMTIEHIIYILYYYPRK